MTHNRTPTRSLSNPGALIGALIVGACSHSVVPAKPTAKPPRVIGQGGVVLSPVDSSAGDRLADYGHAWRDKSDLPSLRTAIAAQVRMAEQSAESSTRRLVALTRAAEGQCLMGEFLYAQSAAPELTAGAFERGMHFAELARGQARTSEEIELTVYLNLANRLGWTRSRGYLEQVDHERTVIRALQALTDSHENLSTTLASALATAADPTTRDLPASRIILEGRLAKNPWDLMARVTLARDYAVAAQDHDLFERELRELVMRTSGSQADPLIRVIAARYADRLLRLAPSLFE